jgi:hypothetical protein
MRSFAAPELLWLQAITEGLTRSSVFALEETSYIKIVV